MPDPLVGKPAPPVRLPYAGGEYAMPIGDKPIAFFFYPKANTMGCTREACSFRDAHAANAVFKAHPELEVVGISRDPVDAQITFAETNSLPFPLLSDTGGEVHKAYGIGKALFGLAPERKTVFIGADGVVKAVHVANVDMASHARFVEGELKKLDAMGPGGA